MNTKFTTDTKLESEIAYFEKINLKLESGDVIDSFKLAFKTFGKLNNDKTNAILVCHALTGDQYVAGNNPITGREGWWSRMVGPNKPIDTNKFFVICSNVLGGCAGSTGPKELQDASEITYGGNFPSVTIKDIVKAQSLLIESLNTIEEGSSKFIVQNDFDATYAKKIVKSETKINWNLDANKVLAHIHGLSPNPGSWFKYENERFKILRAKIAINKGKPGFVLDGNLTIGCKSNSIQILELQRQGRNKQSAKEFLLGKAINKGSVLS